MSKFLTAKSLPASGGAIGDQGYNLKAISMDIFAHALWTGLSARGANASFLKKRALKIKIFWAGFWGIFPDLFAFVLPMIFSVPYYIIHGFSFGRPSSFGISHELYNYSHSLVIWAAVFIFIWLVSKRPRLALLGWALHILIDIPSHAADFFPTPFLFPISDFHFIYGVPWSNKWYMIINYTLLFSVLLSVAVHDVLARKKQKQLASYMASE